jgi:small subunit ribosomal protein S4
MNYNGPKARRSRRLGIAITTKTQKQMERRAYPPGQHGKSKRINKLSDFGRQMQEKQRLRAQYNITERQLRRFYAEAARSKESTPEKLIQLLETRLDAVVYRAGFARSIFAARQYVSHGHITVNGKKVDIASFNVQLGDVVSIREKSKAMEAFKHALATSQHKVAYIVTDDAGMTAKLSYLPKRDEIPVICQVPAVVEFYSR